MKCVLIAGLCVFASGASVSAEVLSFDLGLGVQSTPGYFGDDDVESGATGSFALDRLVLGGLTIGGGDPNGFGFKGAFRAISERSVDNHAELAGLDDVDAAVEVGAGLTFTALPDGVSTMLGNYVFAEVRYGVVGHESYVAEIGTDVIYKPSPEWEFRAGPRLFAGDDDYAATYFSDTRVGYEADGGLLSRGFQASAGYDFNDDWGVLGTVRYDQFTNDAADSPIVQNGSEDQVSMSLIVTRAISF